MKHHGMLKEKIEADLSTPENTKLEITVVREHGEQGLSTEEKV